MKLGKIGLQMNKDTFFGKFELTDNVKDYKLIDTIKLNLSPKTFKLKFPEIIT